MNTEALINSLKGIFEDETLFGFAKIDAKLALEASCKCAVVTLLPYPDLEYKYNPIEYYQMLEELRKKHCEKLDIFKCFLQENKVRYAIPPASPKNDGRHFAEFSYKWAAIHAGLGFIGKNDVFVSKKFAQRVRISCLLVDFALPVYTGEMVSECASCDLCVKSCPHGYVSGLTWHKEIKRSELVDYMKCSLMSKHEGAGAHYSCAHCSLACTYPKHL